METGIGLGSNLGDRLERLAWACGRVATLPGARLLARSRVYETAPVDVAPAFRDLAFLNAVAVIDWPGDVHDLAARLRRIEEEGGRRRTADRNAPRPIDLDVLYFGDAAIDEPALKIPHPRWAVRRFVVEPLADVRPGLRLPGAGGRTVSEVLAGLPDQGVRLLAKSW